MAGWKIPDEDNEDFYHLLNITVDFGGIASDFFVFMGGSKSKTVKITVPLDLLIENAYICIWVLGSFRAPWDCIY